MFSNQNMSNEEFHVILLKKEIETLRAEGQKLQARITKEIPNNDGETLSTLKHRTYETADVNELAREIEMLGWQINDAKKLLDDAEIKKEMEEGQRALDDAKSG